LEREYRQIVAEIPVGALLGAEPELPMPTELLGVFYRYVDLTNQQVFLRSQQRVSAATWANWRDGIAHQLRRPALAAAWTQSKHDAPEDFVELRQLEHSGFADDPADWSTLPTSNGQRRGADAPASSRAA
jgi:hypothetical protein